MRGADLRTQVRRQAEQPAQPPECGRASPRRGRHLGGMLEEVAVAVPKSSASKYIGALQNAPNPMRRALLHQRAAECLEQDGKVAESKHHAQEAERLFTQIREYMKHRGLNVGSGAPPIQ